MPGTVATGIPGEGSAFEAMKVMMARLTGLEPATPGVTGRYSNRLSYNRAGPAIGCGGGAVDGTRTRDPRRDRPVL